MVREETDKKAGTIQARSFKPELCIKLRRNAKLKEKHKWSNENPNSIMPEDYEEFMSLQGIQRNHQDCSQEIGNTNGSRCALQDKQEE